MRFASKSVTALALVFALTACGGGTEEADQPAAGDIPGTSDGAAPVGEATPAATDSPAPGDTATPQPTSTPSPTASASAAPTTAAVTEPAAFAVCKACHSVEPGKHGIGPSLAGIWGEKAAAVPGYEFSEPMKASGLTWNQATLDRYLADPRGTVPGTKMAFGGVADAAKRQAIIDYIRGL